MGAVLDDAIMDDIWSLKVLDREEILGPRAI
jgi:hypothetical protein